jgi:hypothetical protein
MQPALCHHARASGLSDKNWREEHLIPVSNFYYQVRRLQKMACEISPKKDSITEKKPEIVELFFNDSKVYPMRAEPETKRTANKPTAKIIASGMQIEARHSLQAVLPMRSWRKISLC